MKMDYSPTDDGAMELVTVKADSPALLSDDLSTDRKVEDFLTRLLPARRSAKTNPAAALVPWVCDRLPSRHSREAYGRDLAAFVLHMQKQGIDPLQVTGDDLRVYKAALLEAGRSSTTVARVLSVLRGTYQQFGIHGLVQWDRVRDLQGVTSPRIDKNTTPVLSELEAKRLLHAPDRSTIGGLRNHAMLFTFFKTASRCSALANAKVGHIERTDKKRQRKALLEAAPAVMAYMDAAGIAEDRNGPLFRPVAKDRRTLLNKGMDPERGDAILAIRRSLGPASQSNRSGSPTSQRGS